MGMLVEDEVLQVDDEVAELDDRDELQCIILGLQTLLEFDDLELQAIYLVNVVDAYIELEVVAVLLVIVPFTILDDDIIDELPHFSDDEVGEVVILDEIDINEQFM